MKNKSFISILIIFALIISSCEYDNYEAPSIKIKGHLTYNGQPFLYDGSTARGVLSLVQSGFGKTDGGTTLRIDESGSFTQLIFPGDYGLTLSNNPYPFEFKDFKSNGTGLGYDTIPMKISSDVSRDFEVTPYYTFSDYTATVVGDFIEVNFKVSKVAGTLIPAPKLVRARCFVSTSSIVNSSTLCSKQKIGANADVNIKIQVPISTSYRTIYKSNFRDYAFCRVSVELDGIPNYYLFSETLKVEGLPVN